MTRIAMLRGNTATAGGGASAPRRKAVKTNFAAIATITSTTYATWTEFPAFTFVKGSADTILFGQLSMTCYKVTATGPGYFAVQLTRPDGSTQDYELTFIAFNSLNVNTCVSGFVSMPEAAVGTYTVRLRSKVSAGGLRVDSLNMACVALDEIANL